MSDPKTYQRLVETIRAMLDDYETPITLETQAADVPQWDSINHINIVVAVESAFKIKFRTAEIERLRNVGDFVELIEQKLS
jgi:acyl carrier protein